MEFLLTYGWAILVVLVVIGALSYFGVLNPSRLLPSKCYFGTFGKCEDFVVISDVDNSGTGDDNFIWFYLMNNLGRSIETLDTTYKGDAGCEIGLIVVLEPTITPGDVFDAVLGGTCTGNTLTIIICLINKGYLKVVPPDKDFKDRYCTPDACTTWQPGEKASIILANCPGITKGSRIKEQIDLVYAFAGASEFTHTTGGEISAVAVESPFTS